MKRSLSLFLAMVMILSCMPVSAFAQETLPTEPVAETTESTVTETGSTVPAETAPEVIPETTVSETTEAAPETTEPSAAETTEPSVADTAAPAAQVVSFVCSPENLDLTVCEAGEKEAIAPSSAYVYELVPGSYTYSAACPGYAALTEIPFTVENSMEISIVLDAEQKEPAAGSQKLQPGEVALNAENFPDPVFLRNVSRQGDSDENGILDPSEIELFTSFDLNNYEGNNVAADLTGISYLKNLTYLNLQGQNINSLDLSGFQKLQQVSLGSCQLASLTLVDLPKLTRICCTQCPVSAAVLRNLPELSYLQFYDTELTSLNVREFPKLETLYAAYSALTELDVTQNQKLKYLDCAGNRIRTIDLSHNPLLEYLSIQTNPISSLDLTHNAPSCRVDTSYFVSEWETDTGYIDIQDLPGFDPNRVVKVDFGSIDSLGRLWPHYSGTADEPFFAMYTYQCSENFAASFKIQFNMKPVDAAPIDEKHFPDAVFRSYIAENADTDRNGILSLSEAMNLTFISLIGNETGGKKITDLRGIEYFHNLHDLDCSGHPVSYVDLSQNPNIQILSAEACNFETLDVSHNPQLSTLQISRNPLKKLDVSHCPMLNVLSCENDPLTSLDVSHNPELFGLYFEGSRISSLKLPATPKIGVLDAGNNRLTNLDLSSCTALSSLDFKGNPLYSIILPEHLVIDDLAFVSDPYVKDCPEGKLDLSTLPGFDMLRATDWQGGTVKDGILTADQLNVPVRYTYRASDRYSFRQTIILRSHPAENVEINTENFPDGGFRSYVSENIDRDHNNILSPSECESVTVLDFSPDKGNIPEFSDITGVSHFKNLSILNLGFMPVRTLDLSGNPLLTELYCRNMNLQKLDLRQTPLLRRLDCSNSKLTELNLQAVPDLYYLKCDNTKIKSLDVSGLSLMGYLSCCGNSLQELNLSQNSHLTQLFVSRNSLKTLDLTACPHIAEVYCSHNCLEEIRFNRSSKVIFCEARDNSLTSLDGSVFSAYAQISVDNNKRVVKAENGTFDLKTLPGFELSKASDWVGGTVDAQGILTPDAMMNPVTYHYQINERTSAVFTLIVIDENTQYIALDAFHFPDRILRQYLERNADLNGDGYLDPSELSQVTSIQFNYDGPENAAGIEYFKDLKELYLHSNDLTSLDVSHNTALESLTVTGSKVPSLDLSQNTALTALDLSNSQQLTSLKISSCKKLKTLDVRSTALTSLDLTPFTELTSLDVSLSKLTSLDVSKNPLVTLNCYCLNLGSLDLSNNTALQELNCHSCHLQELDLHALTELTMLSCGGNDLKTLDISALKKLDTLYCDFCSLKELDISNNPALRTLHIPSNQLTSIDFSGCPNLEYAECSGNRLPFMNVPGNADFSCNDNTAVFYAADGKLDLKKIKGFDLSRASQWQGGTVTEDGILTADEEGAAVNYLYRVNDTKAAQFTILLFRKKKDITAIDAVSFPDPEFREYVRKKADLNKDGVLDNEECARVIDVDAADPETHQQIPVHDFTGIQYFVNLSSLYVPGTQITKLDLSHNRKLTHLYAGNCGLEHIDLSQNTHLQVIHLIHNAITELDVRNHKELTSLSVTGTKITSLDLSQNPELSYLEMDDCPIQEIDLSYNPALEHLYISNTGIHTIDLAGNNALIELYANGCGLKNLDLSGKSKLNTLEVDRNQLETLDLSDTPNLWALSCSENKLKTLDLSGQANLSRLICAKNMLTRLDLTDCTALNSLNCSGNFLSSLNVNHMMRLYHVNAADNHSAYNTPDGKLNLGKVPGFLIACASEWKGGRVENGILIPDQAGKPVTYSYDMGRDYSAVFTITVNRVKVEPGWHKLDGKWQFIHADGSFTANDFEKIGAYWYFFDADGLMVTGWKLVNGKYYYFNSNGFMAMGWRQIAGKYYYFDGTGAMVTGWKQISGKYYYFESSGAMAVSKWIGASYVGADGAWDPSKEPSKAEWRKENGKWWYRHADGGYSRNAFERIDYHWYFFDRNGYMVTGWLHSGNTYYYFNSNGWMTVGWLKLNGTYYYFDGTGAMVTGWEKIGGKYYYFASSGAMAASKWIGDSYVGADGAWDPNAAPVKGQWRKAGSYWWYRHEDGSYTSNDFEYIDGHMYYFGSTGLMVTGWKLISGKYYYFNASGWMTKGWRNIDSLYYYFGNDGAMITGWKHIGSHDYYFNQSGDMAVNTWIGSYYVGADGAWDPNAVR